MESQEPPTNWGGAGEIDNNSVPFSSGENEMPERDVYKRQALWQEHMPVFLRFMIVHGRQ